MSTDNYPNENTFADEAKEGARSVAEKVTSAASQVKDTVADFGRNAVNKIDRSREPAAKGLESAASGLHDKAEGIKQGGEKVTSFAHNAADKLSSTAEYVRSNDVKSMVTDLEHVVRRNPGPSLLLAAIGGFFVGRALRNSD